MDADDPNKADRGAPSQPAQFPPVARIPVAPMLPADPRQSRTGKLLGAGRAVESEIAVSGPNLSAGFHAASVDVGRLQEMLERGLSRFPPEQLEERWDELRRWISQLIHAWVQRCKMLRVERHENGISVELQTQDDLGYYTYAFDVFPRRAR